MLQRSILLFGAVMSCAAATAQFPVAGTSPTRLLPLLSLGSGTKYAKLFQEGSNQSTIYSADLTPYRVLNYPDPAAGYTWTSMAYVTEELFDTDPSTIEFLLIAAGDAGIRTAVYHEDGTLLFDEAGFASWVQTGMGSHPAIYMIDGQAYMVVHATSDLNSAATVYELPGTLPCADCHGMPTDGMVTSGGGIAVGPSGMSLQPNPARHEITVKLDAASAGANGTIVLTDAGGRVVLEQPYNATSTVVVPLIGLAPGVYHCAVVVDGRRSVALPFVVEK